MNTYHAEPKKDRIVPTKMISVWLENSSPQREKLFRCVSCGLPVLQYYSDVRMIFIGGETPLPENPTAVHSHPLVVRCKRCKQEYKFE